MSRHAVDYQGVLSDAAHVIDQLDEDVLLLPYIMCIYLTAMVSVQPIDIVLDWEQVSEDLRILRHQLCPKYYVATV